MASSWGDGFHFYSDSWDSTAFTCVRFCSLEFFQRWWIREEEQCAEGNNDNSVAFISVSPSSYTRVKHSLHTHTHTVCLSKIRSLLHSLRHFTRYIISEWSFLKHLHPSIHRNNSSFLSPPVPSPWLALIKTRADDQGCSQRAKTHLSSPNLLIKHTISSLSMY